MTWREAFSTAINNLFGVNDSPSVKKVRLLFFLLFIAGTGWAAYNYYNAIDLLAEKEFSPSATASEVQADKKRLNAMIEQVRTASTLRTNSVSLADNMETASGKYVVMDPAFITLQETKEDPNAAIVVQPEIVVEMPPEIVVRAIMQMGKRQVAVMDIAGVGSGLVVRAGDTFMQKKGRVVRITPDKVVVRWGGKNWDIAPGF